MQSGLKSELPRSGDSDRRVPVSAEEEQLLGSYTYTGRGDQEDVNKPLQEPKEINVLRLPVEEGKGTAFLCSLFPPKLFSTVDKIILLFLKALRSEFSSSFRSR